MSKLQEEKTYKGLLYKIYYEELGCHPVEDNYYCCYIGIPEGHPLYKVYYDDIENIDTSNLTFSDFSERLGGDLWWIGFNTDPEGSNRHILKGYKLEDCIKLTRELIDQISRKYG